MKIFSKERMLVKSLFLALDGWWGHPRSSHFSSYFSTVFVQRGSPLYNLVKQQRRRTRMVMIKVVSFALSLFLLEKYHILTNEGSSN